MKIPCWTVCLTIAALGFSAQAQAQGLGLEPTIKVHPSPQVQTNKPISSGQCVCTQQYDPVCARASGAPATTYGNACQARCAGATVLNRGPC